MNGAASFLRSAAVFAVQVTVRLCAIALALSLAIAAGALVHTELTKSDVVRIAMNEVPVERVVEFGHEEGAFAMVLPVSPPPSADTKVRPAAITEALTRPMPRTAQFAPDENGVLPINFTLEEGETAIGGGVGVKKTIALQQGEMTGLTIFIVGDAMIEVERGELAKALEAIGAGSKAAVLPQAGRTGRLSLDRVRHAGLDLRYDAIQDRLVLHP